MKKYISREVVEAKQLTESDKDGLVMMHIFDIAEGGYINRCIESWYGKEVAEDRSAAAQVPYIELTKGLKTFYGDGYYLVKNAIGVQTVMEKEEFEAKYGTLEEEKEEAKKDGQLMGVKAETPSMLEVASDLVDMAEETNENMPLLGVIMKGDVVDSVFNITELLQVPMVEGGHFAGLVLENAETNLTTKEEDSKIFAEKLAGAMGVNIGKIKF